MAMYWILRGIHLFFQVYTLLLFARILSSWVPSFQGTKIFRFIAFYTDPYLDIFRRLLPPLRGVLDISPILAFFALRLLEKMILGIFL